MRVSRPPAARQLTLVGAPQTRRRWLAAAAWLVSLHVVLLYGLPGALSAALVLLLGWLYARQGAPAAIVMTLALATVTAIYAVALKVSGLDQAIYYRPHERLVSYDYAARHRAYRPNASVQMRVPHGDLKALTSADLAVPHDVTFQTDADGFRNDRDYHGQRYVLVGDSFVVGVNDSQADTLSAQLARDHGLDTYNLGHPGDLGDYASYVAGFRAHHGDGFRALLFVFEGNDLADTVPPSDREKYSAAALLAKRYFGLFSDAATYRFTRSLIRRAQARGDIAASKNVRVAEVGGQRIGFYVPYIDATRATTYQPDESVARTILAFKPNLDRIFFVPTKYRVYAGQIDPAVTLPNARWEWLESLCRRERLACTDLSPALIAAAADALKRNQLIWWADDTHWNRDGIAVAAREVARQTFRTPPAPPRINTSAGRRANSPFVTTPAM